MEFVRYIDCIYLRETFEGWTVLKLDGKTLVLFRTKT